MSHKTIHCPAKLEEAITAAKAAGLHVTHVTEHDFRVNGPEDHYESFAQHPGIITFTEGKSKPFHPYFRYALTAPLDPSNHTAVALGKYYNFPPQQGTPPTIAIISLGGTYLTSDLRAYWDLQGISPYPHVSYVQVGNVSNAPDQPIVAGDGSEENSLDIQIASSLCPQAKIVVYFGQNSTQGFYDAISAAVHDTVNNPGIISISWGAPEDTFTHSDLAAYDALFAAANNRGQTITVAAGDNGSSDGESGLHVDFPSSSPHVVSCGGTRITASGETAWSWSTATSSGTGGGISSYFPQPSYQRWGALNKANRTVPDIALNADPASGWTICFNGQIHTNSYGGTSCVAPALAGLLGLMNLRFASSCCNALYNAKRSVCFRDITTGNNGAYSATRGYDLCTGLGSVNGTELLQYLTTHGKAVTRT